MADVQAKPTNPEAGVAQVAPEDVQTRMMNYLAQSEDQEQEEQAPAAEPETETQQAEQGSEQPEGQAPDGELTPDDIPDDTPEQPNAVDEFEIVHQGQQRKLSREEVIKLAQQGFDYTQKTQSLAEKDRAVSERLEMLKEIESVQPHLAQELAQVKAIEAQLDKYQNVDWVKVATDDPLEYPKYRAQYDVLMQAYNQATGQYNQKSQAVLQQVSAIRQKMLQEEAAKLPTLIPEWKDEAKQAAGRQELTKYLIDQGADPNLIGLKTQDALSVAIAYKAMKYDKLLKGKAEKVGQLKTVPPVTRPGASQTLSAKADQAKKLEDRLRKSGDIKDAAALLLTRMK